jgi:phage shock protein A
MAGLLSKIRIAVLSNANALVDRMIDLNSVEAVKQYIRDLEASLSELRESAAVATGSVTTTKRDLDKLQASADELDHNIDFILTDADDSNDHLATSLQVRLTAIQSDIAAKQEELEAAETTAQSLGEAAQTLGAKHAEMLSNLTRLQAQDRSAKAKKKAADALEAAGQSMSSGADASVDDVAAGIQRESDVQDARLAQAMGTFESGVDNDVAFAQANAALAERKARLKAGAAAPAAEPVPTA